MSENYIIITPAFNEAAYIERTIQSVLAQTHKPRVWVIVDDGSTDRTAEIVKRYAREHPWIWYVYRQKDPNQTYYASNVYAIQYGLNQLQHSNFKLQDSDYLAILDADIELCVDYYEKIFLKYSKYPQLGIATGTYLEKENGKWVEAKIDRRSTPKAIQVFRQKCYVECGGYIPFKYGGEDSGMEITARMKGWHTWSFNEIQVKHYRPVGTANGYSLLGARFRLGLSDYCLGTHPFFMLMKSLKRCFWEKPYVLSGLMRLSGYLAGWIKQEKRQIPADVMAFLRKEQINRLRNFKSPESYEEAYKYKN
jgi:glycosyltransferase involved in cell wall biosynthesis